MRESVERYAVTHIGHGGVRTLAQGRFTYATKAEAQAWINAAMMENSEARLKESYGLPLEVRACRCRAGNFDPKEIYFDYGARS